MRAGWGCSTNAESEAQRDKPKGTLESEIRIAISLLGQRPPRCSRSLLFSRVSSNFSVGRKKNLQESHSSGRIAKRMTEPELVGNAAAEEMGFSKEDIDEEKVKQWPPSVSLFAAL